MVNSNWIFVHSRNTSFNHPERNAKRPCWTMLRHESEHTKISWIFHIVSYSLSNINICHFLFFISFQLDPSLAPQPERLFFDGTLSIYHYLCSKIAPWRHHSLWDIRSPGGLLLDPQSDRICKVELHKIDPQLIIPPVLPSAPCHETQISVSCLHATIRLTSDVVHVCLRLRAIHQL